MPRSLRGLLLALTVGSSLVMGCKRKDAVSTASGSAASAAAPVSVPIPPDASPPRAPFIVEKSSVVGAWDLIVEGPVDANVGIASDIMRHVFREDGSVAVRMDQSKNPAFPWAFREGKHSLGYADGEREFRFLSEDEAQVIEADGNVLENYVREGSRAAQEKPARTIFAELAAAKSTGKRAPLIEGRSFVLTRQTTLMSCPDGSGTPPPVPRKKVRPGSRFTIRGHVSVYTDDYSVVVTPAGRGCFHDIDLMDAMGRLLILAEGPPA